VPKAIGPFTVKLPTLSVHDAVEGLLGRRAIDKTYEGPLSGTGRGEMLMAGTATPGSAGYVALERFEGSLDGRAGGFHLQHFGLMNRGQGSLRVEIIPDSGTGELTGLTGSMQIHIAPGGAHSYELDYAVP
jgi:hypothetical protein